jgi:hypothetical protein
MSLFTFATVASITAKLVTPKTLHFGDLELLYLSHDKRPNKDGLGFIFATFTERRRLDANVERVTAIALDIDSKEGQPQPPAFDDVVSRVRSLGVAACAWTTYSHTPETPRYRIVCPLSEPMNKSALTIAQDLLAESLGLKSDPACKNAGRIYLAPSCPPERAQFAAAWLRADASMLGPEQFERRATMAASLEAATRAAKRRQPISKANGAALIDKAAREVREASERNVALNRWGYTLGKAARDGVIDATHAESVLAEAALSAGLPPREVAYTLRRALRQGGAA